MDRTKRPRALHRAVTLTLAAACAALAGCRDVPTAPELDLRPSYLIGGSPLSLADPRPSPWSDGKGLEIEVTVSGIGGDIERYSFRTSARLTLGDGSVALINPKSDPAALVDPKDNPVRVTLVLPFGKELQAALGKEREAVRTEVAVELLEDGRTVDRVETTAYLKY